MKNFRTGRDVTFREDSMWRRFNRYIESLSVGKYLDTDMIENYFWNEYRQEVSKKQIFSLISRRNAKSWTFSRGMKPGTYKISRLEKIPMKLSNWEKFFNYIEEAEYNSSFYLCFLEDELDVPKNSLIKFVSRYNIDFGGNLKYEGYGRYRKLYPEDESETITLDDVEDVKDSDVLPKNLSVTFTFDSVEKLQEFLSKLN